MKKSMQDCIEKRIRGLSRLLILMALLSHSRSYSQVNLASQATVTQAFPVSGVNGPLNYNDGVIQAYPGTSWGYVTTFGYITFTWPSAKIINKMKFYKAGRPMTSCTLQYWNGSTFVDFYNYTSSSVELDSAEFAPVTTTMLRMETVAATNPGASFREIQIYKVLGPANDIGVASVDSPSVFCGGPKNIVATIRNYGSNQVTNASVNWSLNGVPQTPVTYSGLLDTLGGSGPISSQIILGSLNFVPNTPYTVKAWTSSPNGQPDIANGNDTTSRILKSSLNGSYTIGAAGSDYASISAAAADLKTYGVCGPVVLNIRTGTYNEQVAIDDIPGASALNRITFRSMASNPDSVTVSFGSNQTQNYVIRLNNSKYITLKDITVSPLNGMYGCGIVMAGACSSDTIKHCVINEPDPSGFSIPGNRVGIRGENLEGSDLVVLNNTVTNAVSGVWISGSSFVAKPEGLIVVNNMVNDVRESGIVVDNFENVKIANNTVGAIPTGATSFYGVTTSGCDSAMEVAGNVVTAGASVAGSCEGYTSVGCIGSANKPQLIFNNVFTGTSDFVIGIDLQGSVSQRCYNNSVKADGIYGYAFSVTSYDPADDIVIMNNILINDGGGIALGVNRNFIYTSGGITTDYNLLYSSGSNLMEDIYVQTYSDLGNWRSATGQDLHSTNYLPVFTGGALQPDITDGSAWALNGKGIQLPEVAADINGNSRSTTVQNGVPDIGAYEITPASVPPLATADPATPMAGSTQTFMFAGDTVASIAWNSGSAVPATVSVRQYSGQQPVSYPGNSAFFYTAVDAPAGSYNYNINVNYRDNWIGTVAGESGLRLAKRDGTAMWSVYNGTQSVVNTAGNTLTSSGLTGFSSFSGVDGSNLIPIAQPGVKSSNLVFSNITGSSMNISWTNGNGNARMVIARAITAVSAVPVDNMIYNANPVFGQGTDMGSSSYVVYNGTGNSVTVTGLQSDVKYNVSVYEYNDNGSSKNYAATALKGSATTKVDYVEMLKAGIPVAENFDDSLSAGVNLPLGWSFVESGTGANAAYSINNGTSATGNTYSYGTTSATDRALGSLQTTAVVSRFGVKLVNKSKVAVTSLVVQYTGEQWRRGGSSTAGNPDRLRVQYATNATDLINATWNTAANLDFASLQTGATAGALNGNLAANRTQITGSITGLNLLPGSTIWIRFSDEDLAGNDDGLAIDDFTVIPFSNTYTASSGLPAGTYNDLNVAGGTISLDSTVVVKTSLNIEKNAALNIAGRKLTLRGQIFGNGTMSGSNTSILSVGGSGLNQTLRFTPGSNSLYQLIISANASSTLASSLNIASAPKGGCVKIGSGTAGNGILNTGDSLVLKSDSLATASITAVYGSLNGRVTIERWMQTDSSIRFLSHPFSAGIPLSQLSDDIALNTSGGAGQNLWRYNPATANPSGITSLASDMVWTPYSNTTTDWNPYQVLRLLKGNGAATLDMTGNVNQGNVAVTVAGGVTDSFVVIGNPYPAGLKLGAALAAATAPGGAMSASAIWTWDPTKGNAGGFTVIPNSKFAAAKIPVCGAFVAMVTPNGSATLNFTETDKTTTGNTKTSFKADGEEEVFDSEDEDPGLVIPEGLELTIEKDGKAFDDVYIYINKDAKALNERLDAPKLINPNFNFSSLSSDGEKLSIDVRPFEAGKQIGMDLATTEAGKFRIRTADFNLSASSEMFLVDRYTNKEEQLSANTSYNFTIDGNDKSKGGRFYLRMGKSTHINATDVFEAELTPNPAKDQVSLRIITEQKGNGIIRILSETGQQMLRTEFDASGNQSVSLPIANLAAGLYIVDIDVNGQKQVKQLLKQ